MGNTLFAPIIGEPIPQGHLPINLPKNLPSIKVYQDYKYSRVFNTRGDAY